MSQIKKYLRKTVKWIFYIGSYALVLSIILALVFRSAWIQHKLTGFISTKIAQKTGFFVAIDRIEPSWIDVWNIKGVKIVDPQETEMVACTDIIVNFNLRNLIIGDAFKLDAIELYNPALRLAYHKENGTLNLHDFLDKLSPPDSLTEETQGFFRVNRIRVRNGLFALDNELSGYSTEAFDENHFQLSAINVDVDGLRVWGDSIEIEVDDLNCQHTKSGIKAHKLETLFTYSKNAMVFAKLRLDVGNSILRDSLIFQYHSFSDFKNFNNKVRLSGSLDHCEVDTRDLAVFNSFFGKYRDKYSINALLLGTVDRIQLKSAQIGFGLNSIITGDFAMIGLPKIDETLLSLDCKSFTIEAGDLLQYTGFKEGKVITKLGRMVGSLDFTGFYYDFVAETKLTTQLGQVKGDINLKLDGEENTTYKGRLQTKDFDMGSWLDRAQYVGLITMDGNIEGIGLSLKNAKINIKALINKIEILKYPYKKININASLAANLFDGYINVLDSNLSLKAKGQINLEKGKEKFDLKGELFHCQVDQLFFPKNKLVVSTKFNANSRGLKLDSLSGYIHLENLKALYIENEIKIQSLRLSSIKNGEDRLLNLQSSIANASLKGDFYLTPLIEDVVKTVNEYRLGIENNELAQKQYYDGLKQFKNETGYFATLSAQINDLNPLLRLFSDQWYLSPNIKIAGSVQMDKNRQIQLYTTCDTLIVYNQHFYNNTLDIYTSKSKYNSDFLAMVNGESKKQLLASSFEGEELLLEAIWSDTMIAFNHHIKQVDQDNHAYLEGDLILSKQGYLINIAPSHLKVLDNVWQFTPGNTIKYNKEELEIHDLKLMSNSQMIAFEGKVSPDSNQFISLKIMEFELKQASPLIQIPIEGVFNAEVTISELFNSKKITWNSLVDSLIIDRFYVGNIEGKGNWQNEAKQLQIDVDVERDKNKLISLDGYIDPKFGNDALNLKATFREARLELLEPFFKEDISEVSGKVIGSLSVTGSLSKPVITGDAEIVNARMRVNYLNTVYTFSDRITFREQEFGLRNVKLFDEKGNIATVRRAAIIHEGFSNIQFEVVANLNNFLILNQKEDLEELYYATAVVTGSVALSGTPDNLQIKANAQSNKGTRIFIPINSTNTFAQQEFINFINPDKTGKVEITKQTTTDLTGIEMDFNLELTPDAQFEIIFDKRSGDIIKGSGQGKMQMQIDTRGDFNLLGNYEIIDGTYNFTFLNVVNKKFNIKPGSRISWSGDPYSANMDIKASYIQNVSLLPILNIVDSALIQQPEIRRRYPTELFLNLTGPLLNPNFKFDIKISNFPQNIITPSGSFSLTNSVLAFYSNIQNNEQEMNRQVFSLIALRRLSPDNSFAGSNQMVGNSLTELLSNQLSSWMSQVNDNLEIDLDLNGLDADALNTMQVRLSYSLLNGKIRVTRDGTFTNNQNQTSLNSIMGDWMVEYRLDDKGKFRIKAFNRNNYNVINSNINNTSTAGVSLVHSETFDKFKELIKRKKNEEQTPTNPKNENSDEEPMSDSDKNPVNPSATLRKEEE